MPDTVMSHDAPIFRNRSPSIAGLAAALAAAQKAFAPIPKDREVTVTTQTGGAYKFKYATLDAIRAATMPALAEQTLAISQALTHWGDHYAVETTLYHSSGEWISNITPMFLSGRRTREGKELPPGNQELGSAQTYARRYGLSALLCITADEDDDGNSADGNHAEGAERVPYRPVRGSAGSGGDFRPDGPRRFVPPTHQNGVRQASVSGARMAADEPESVARAQGRMKGTMLPSTDTATQAGFGRAPTVEEARAAKIKAATDKRIADLRAKKDWTRAELDKFWDDDKTWIEWMADANNEALKEYERFTDAFAEAEISRQETA